MRAEEHGAMVPVCTGALKIGGRERVAGEVVPEVMDWSPSMRQLHINNGNLAFVNREQAAEMSAKADKTLRVARRRDLQNAAQKLRHAFNTLDAKLTEHNRQGEELGRKIEKALYLAVEAEELIEAFDDGQEIPVAEPVQWPPSTTAAEEKRKAEEAGEEKVDLAKAAAKRRLAEVLKTLPRHTATKIEEYYSNLSYNELRSEGRALDLTIGSLPKAEVLQLVIEEASSREVKRMADAEVDKTLADGEALVDGAEGSADTELDDDDLEDDSGDTEDAGQQDGVDDGADEESEDATSD